MNGAESRRTAQLVVGAHPRSHFSVDEWVSMVLKYTETGNCLETIRRFQKQFLNQRTLCRQTIMDNYNKYVQYGLSLNRYVGNSRRSFSETAFETFWLFPEHYRFLYTLKPFPHPFIYWKLLSGMITSHLRTVLPLSATGSIRLFFFLVSLIIKY